MSTRENTFINVEERVFYIHDNIDHDNMSKVIYYLLLMLEGDQKKEDEQKNYERKPIKIYINSYGGYVDDMWSLVDIMLASKTPIHTYSTGYADSCGFFIFIAGTERYITKHTRMVLHQISSGTRGIYQCMKEHMKELDKDWAECEEYILAQTKITREDLDDMKERKIDWHIRSDESIKLGVATDIIAKF